MNQSCVTCLYIHRYIRGQFEYVCILNYTFVFLNVIDLWIALGHISISVKQNLKKLVNHEQY
jgi:hypothetical protein